MSYSFRTVMGQSSYRAWKNWAASDYLVGKYVSESTDSFGNPNYKVEVIEAKFEDGSQPKPGATFSFNSSGTLKKAMEEVAVGDIVKVIYKGEDVVSKGKFKGKKFHSMEVLVSNSKKEESHNDHDSSDLI